MLANISYKGVSTTMLSEYTNNLEQLDTYILKFNNYIGKDDINKLFCYISEEKKQRILRFHRFEDAQRTLLGDILARYAICIRTGVQNKELHFDTNKFGKPILIAPNEIHFNISHSENWVVCAIDKKVVGIDVEVVKPIDLHIAEKFFSEAEYLSLINQPKELQTRYFYMIWTLKESYIKAEGKGLSIPLNSFEIKPENLKLNITLNEKEKDYHFHQSFLSNDTIYAICTLNKESFYKTTILDVEDFIPKAVSIL